jgi:predicted metal-dependent phosphoesterase TrpH
VREHLSDSIPWKDTHKPHKYHKSNTIMLFELHAHSWYSKDRFASKGLCSPVELVKVARSKGLNGIAVTDHDSLKAWNTLKEIKLDNFTIIPGEEISTRQGHLIALGITEEISPGMTFMQTLDKIHSQGGIAVAPHPFGMNDSGIGERAQAADAIEVFNAMSLDHFSNVRARIFARYHNKGMTAGSDAHANYMVGRSATYVKSGSNLDSVLNAIKSGQTKTIENYHSVGEMTNWYVDQLNSNPEGVNGQITHNHNLFKQTALRTIMAHKNGKGIISKSLAYSLPYLTTTGSKAKSFFVNGPQCLM